ncbi:MAG: aromatic amino acid lyase, partial [Planctomycetota bacterium]
MANAIANVIVNGENLQISHIEPVARKRVKVGLGKDVKEALASVQRIIKKAIDDRKVIYGVTTGFGALSDVFISKGQ